MHDALVPSGQAVAGPPGGIEILCGAPAHCMQLLDRSERVLFLFLFLPTTNHVPKKIIGPVVDCEFGLATLPPSPRGPTESNEDEPRDGFVGKVRRLG